MMRGLLFDTRPADPATYLVVAAGVLALTRAGERAARTARDAGRSDDGVAE